MKRYLLRIYVPSFTYDIESLSFFFDKYHSAFIFPIYRASMTEQVYWFTVQDSSSSHCVLDEGSRSSGLPPTK